MFDIGWTELLLIGIVALIVIGPQDLPDMFRQLGRFTAKLRQMAREFQRAMEQAANDSGVKDVARDINAVANPKSTAMNAVKDAADRFEKWDPLKNAATPTKPIEPSVIKGPTPPPGSIAAPPAPATPAAAPAEAAPVGPATQAEYDKKAARAAIVRETSAKLKAVDAGAGAEAAPAAAKKPRAPRKAATPAAASAPAEGGARPARAPRKKKADPA
jgi:sec-independent protein translocase protein TatB